MDLGFSNLKKKTSKFSLLFFGSLERPSIFIFVKEKRYMLIYVTNQVLIQGPTTLSLSHGELSLINHGDFILNVS